MHPNFIAEQILPIHSPLVSAPGPGRRRFFIGIHCQADQLEFRGSSLPGSGAPPVDRLWPQPFVHE